MLDNLTVTILAEDSVPYESPLLGQHGVSYWLEATRNGTTRNILVDVGQNPDALLSNIEKLGIPIGQTDAIVLTHCHYDHTQGLARILQAIGRKDLPVIAHPALFRLNFVTEPFFQHVGVMQGDKPEDLRTAGAELVLVSGPLQLMPGLSTTGEVPRVTDFEEVGIALSTLDENGGVIRTACRTISPSRQGSRARAWSLSRAAAMPGSSISSNMPCQQEKGWKPSSGDCIWSRLPTNGSRKRPRPWQAIRLRSSPPGTARDSGPRRPYTRNLGSDSQRWDREPFSASKSRMAGEKGSPARLPGIPFLLV